MEENSSLKFAEEIPEVAGARQELQGGLGGRTVQDGGYVLPRIGFGGMLQWQLLLPESVKVLPGTGTNFQS